MKSRTLVHAHKVFTKRLLMSFHPSQNFISLMMVGKPEGKRPLGRRRRRWEDNIKMDLQEVGVDCGDWMELAQDRDGGGHL